MTELATAVGRPKSTVANHVKVLTAAGLVQVVRTRRVRAIQERFYGRTARMFYVDVGRGGDAGELPRDFNDFEVAAQESAAAYERRRALGLHRHARISSEQASEFWERMAELVTEFDRMPRSGDTLYGFRSPDPPGRGIAHRGQTPNAGRDASATVCGDLLCRAKYASLRRKANRRIQP